MGHLPPLRLKRGEIQQKHFQEKEISAASAASEKKNTCKLLVKVKAGEIQTKLH